MVKIQNKKTKEIIEATEQEAEDVLEAKKEWVENKKNRLVSVGLRNMSASDIGDIIFGGGKEDFSRDELLRFEKFLEELKNKESSNKNLSYYSMSGYEATKDGLIDGIIGGCHWTIISYMVKQKMIKRIDDKYGWVISDNKAYSEFYKKWRALKELQDKREYAKQMEEEELDNFVDSL